MRYKIKDQSFLNFEEAINYVNEEDDLSIEDIEPYTLSEELALIEDNQDDEPSTERDAEQGTLDERLTDAYVEGSLGETEKKMVLSRFLGKSTGKDKQIIKDTPSIAKFSDGRAKTGLERNCQGTTLESLKSGLKMVFVQSPLAGSI